MAQLPPKIPTNWPPPLNHHGHLPGPPSSASFFPPSFSPPSASLPSEPTWADDEFLHYATPNRYSHRRSMSDSYSIPETLVASPDFDCLHDDNLMYMLSDDMLHSSSAETSAAPCTPSDHDSVTDDKPNPPACSDHDQSEAQSSCNAEQRSSPAAAATSTPDTASHLIVDPKRVKRILANRKSAQRSRVRKMQYITELERSVTKLQMEVSALTPRVAFLDHQRSILTVGNNQLKHRIAALAQDNITKDAHQESLKKEIERLRRAHQQQNIKNMDTMTSEDFY